jgi:hypothetical protein
MILLPETLNHKHTVTVLLSSCNNKRKPQTRGVSQHGLAIYIKKYLKANRRIMETRIYFTMQKYNLQKNPLKETKILQHIITL